MAIYFASELPPPPPRRRRGLVPRGPGRNAALMARLAERLTRSMTFGRLVSDDFFTIGQLAAHLKVSLRTLRFYEQSGLLSPERDGARRLYTREDLDRLKVIVALREMETSLVEIKALMTEIDLGEPDEVRITARVDAMLAALAEGNRARIAELEVLNGRLADLRRGLSD